MRIRYLDARHAGSAHDSLIWNMSHAKQILRERYDGGDRNSWILGKMHHHENRISKKKKNDSQTLVVEPFK